MADKHQVTNHVTEYHASYGKQKYRVVRGHFIFYITNFLKNKLNVLDKKPLHTITHAKQEIRCYRIYV
jgi:hypothetical protein